MVESVLSSLGAERGYAWSEPLLGVRAFLVLDDMTLGPGAGGIRTWRYDSAALAAADAARLARAMTIKCSLAGLAAGGAKTVVIDHEGLDRRRAFEWLGERIEALGGAYRTAGDLGTTAGDLAAMATRTRFVHTNEGELSKSVAQGLLAALEACARIKGGAHLTGLRVAVQGCGAIGSAVARALHARGARLVLSDLDPSRATQLADALDAATLAPDEILLADVDVIAPCAAGGVIDTGVARRISAWGVCGAANNILASEEAGEILRQRAVLFVPDAISSAGAVVDGIGETVMGLDDRSSLIEALGSTAEAVLREALDSGRAPQQVAIDRAWARIESSGGRRRES